MSIKNWNTETICIQGGYTPRSGEPRILPIIQSTTYKYDDPDKVANLFDLKEEGHMYTRISNPTVAAFEEKIAQLEGGVGAVAVSSGQSATTLAVLNICSAGDHILASSNLYGGTFTLISSTLKKLGIEATFVSPEASEEEILKLAKDNTKMVLGETIGNPSVNILDFHKFSNVAKKIEVPFLVDNTLMTPYLCKPFKYGANIVIHSATKYIDGHATSVGGVVIDGGNFNWRNGKFPSLVDKDPTYHGISYTEEFKNLAYITKLRVNLLRDLGTCLSPFNAFLFNLGLETLHLRMERHSENALKLAQFLQEHDKITWVKYPLLKGDKSYENAKKYLNSGASGMLTFGIKGGTDQAKEFIKSLKLASLVIHIGDARTSVLHPSSTTHRQLSYEEQIASGVTEDLIRVSVGIEYIGDIIKDFKEALSKI
ncbi:O-acetylhomoserine aminocarboxypropyltransferase/cysteine synthase family protein [Clostridium botulinum]|uniref:O-acetylhomoserine aminocarboxypropyltransferase/cysteine synthase family protein n=1 Tax=Clostridium botulinum (strain Langeland / NCTC 10281 / Type F) TaxID=441772 RepID=A7GEI8_CLOBL|nr:O-acetylhomoserine aminocarboxypropyltransferase/cysteine synthase family protein [Clostridium botulinum]ABS41805.1 O-acetylhomoserine aminocarboxypropyltransferase/cysteine synthase family protein [Clostridium botulinum F str. Langeland]ADF99613.1 O-acetylhomoserine aminocarboxypropyltransferase/cysteine synthase family protein [Clostridium botulinum F str. 230613]KKM42811.1 O-acetylhomoserine aminocarboxypropyltransferase [Clostridium botulinum]MBY6791671.1 O-acetylhomoserine aminocarboxyp